jgi:hypothetical protein
MSRTRLLLFVALVLIAVTAVSMSAASDSRDPVALIPGGLGLFLGLPLWAERRNAPWGLARWAPVALGGLLVLAVALAQGRALTGQPVLAASTLPLAAALGLLAGLLPRRRRARFRGRRRLPPAALALPLVAALLTWYATFPIHDLLPIVLPALSGVLGVILVASAWACGPSLPLRSPPRADDDEPSPNARVP